MRMALRAFLLVVGCLLLGSGGGVAQEVNPTGPLVYEDTFSDGTKSGLEDNLSATDYSRGFHAPGVYHLIMLSTDSTHWSLFPRQSYGTLTFQAEVWDNSDTFAGDAWLGAIIRAQDASHFYAVLVDPRKGQFAARRLDGGTWVDLIPWTPGAMIRSKAEHNVLRIDADGSTFTIYVNEQKAGTFSDTTYAKGGIGVIAGTADAVQPHMHFDNVKVYSNERSSGTQPGTLPVTGANSDPGLLVILLAAVLLVAGVVLRRVGVRFERRLD